MKSTRDDSNFGLRCQKEIANMRSMRISIRKLAILILCVALSLAWIKDHRRIEKAVREAEQARLKSKTEYLKASNEFQSYVQKQRTLPKPWREIVRSSFYPLAVARPYSEAGSLSIGDAKPVEWRIFSDPGPNARHLSTGQSEDDAWRLVLESSIDKRE
jgi:hypothetical protein